MQVYRELFIIKRNRTIAYTGYPKYLEAIMPQKISYDTPIFAGRFVYLNPNKALYADRWMFADYLVSVKNGFALAEMSDVFIPAYDLLYTSALVHSGDDYRKFYSLGPQNAVLFLLLLDPKEIFAIPYTEEYFKEALEPGDYVGLDGGFYRRAGAGEGAIGVFLGATGKKTRLAHIKFYPTVADSESPLPETQP